MVHNKGSPYRWYGLPLFDSYSLALVWASLVMCGIIKAVNQRLFHSLNDAPYR
ncbi:hypothetical protein [Paenibacillus sp. MMO-58]|uniref:hypothetical protein n=1 Tax=Paenibacillus sp. MMO-58 TaxID=3081290 RepID=UPI00301792CF